MSGGGKTKGLELLVSHHRLGFKVPRFSVIDTKFFDYIQKQQLMVDIIAALTREPQAVTELPYQFKQTVKALNREYRGRPVIVRSSSEKEDGQHSFAGIYESYVIGHSTQRNLAEAVRKVYASFYSEKAQRYRQEHGIKDDNMGVIVQEFIEPDFAGVMYTSNPSFASDFTIEFTRGRNQVVDASAHPFIFDFDKKTKERVFASENTDDLILKEKPNFKRLIEIGIGLERFVGPSDIEFAIKDGEVYLVQIRQITDLHQPVDVKIPRYTKSQFIGATNIIRGTGKVTLPVVKPQPYKDLLERGRVMSTIDDAMTLNMYRDWLKFIVKMDATHSDGYILITPEFNERPLFPVLLGVSFKTDIDSMTPNKKAVITTDSTSIASHIMTIARERGIAYAGFQNGENLFERVSTGDVLSIYFQGRQAHVYKEKVAPKSIRELHPEIKYETRWMDNSYLFVQTSGFLESDKPYSSDFQLFLECQTGKKWKFKPFNEVMGGLFIDSKKRAIVMSTAKMQGEYHHWSLGSVGISKTYGYKPVSKREFNALMNAYAKHLTQ